MATSATSNSSSCAQKRSNEWLGEDLERSTAKRLKPSEVQLGSAAAESGMATEETSKLVEDAARAALAAASSPAPHGASQEGSLAGRAKARGAI
jgi:hypothetical protein